MCGEVQGAGAPASSQHSKVAPAAEVARKPNVAVAALVAVGPLVISVSNPADMKVRVAPVAVVRVPSLPNGRHE